MKPTGKVFASAVAVSRSLYRPTRTIVFALFSVRVIAEKCRLGLDDLASICGMNRIVGCCSFAGVALLGPGVVESISTSIGAALLEPAAAGVDPTAVAARLLAIPAAEAPVSGCAESVLVDVAASLLSPLVGNHPFSPFCILDGCCAPVSALSGTTLCAGVLLVLLRLGGFSVLGLVEPLLFPCKCWCV